MAPVKKRRVNRSRPLADLLPALLQTAIEESNDFILAFETDPDTGRRKIHVMSGKFVTPCMLRKLIGQAESQRDEGSTRISRRWTKRESSE
ncbi:hypothetical protein [Methanoregula sp.]|uniref:hypothetical protein n=1 Tax=Methanoregula sp. TaxID=2052170 RepID=UPI00236EA16F|nr:hypothetical protein [Methanoregula sp.]MDD1686354.1 hypothetical protein [Methanoregula sp.]